ncbi:transglutaminase family protein [Auraticoccus monumenti]|uniref:Transglutaminase-like superfamily protein n=1 Tax=Auraticoccus monumenti TaxID=675864 RepID=A0A1G7DNG3_9ACTN|nr:DUF3488 and transglutaminase-like domain-containing protein [Auraticoccus monumenti]SDE53047.1 Transglutaminase-like superfamily protein [Auraticoccus monumenti]
MRASDRSAIAVMIAVALSSLTLLPLTQDLSYVPLALVVTVAVTLVGGVGRRLALGNGAVLGVQTLVLVAFVLGIALALGGAEDGFLSQVAGLYTSAAEHMRTQAAPMPPHPGVKLLLVTAVGVVAVLTDVLVEGIERPAWAIAPPLTLYLVPALGLAEDLSWWPFVLLAVGYAVVLLSEGLTAADRWPRSVGSADHPQSDQGTHLGYAVRAAAMVVVPVIAATVLVGTVLPLPGQLGWGSAAGRGADGPLQMTDPTLDLKRNLTQPEDYTVLSYQTDGPSGSYLRMASLPVFNDSGWQSAAIALQPGSDLPPPPGLTSEPARTRTTEIQIGDFRSEYLPLPYATRSFQAEGEWAFDDVSLMVLGTGQERNEATRNLSYQVESVDIEPEGSRLTEAEPGTPEDANLTAALPPDLPAEIIDTALEVTQDAESPALKAAALQAFLRSSEFTYSTEPNQGTTYEQLADFLVRDRRGYCEQFAGSMAVMARVVGIPSRVAVGFLPGSRTASGWEVSVRDMHAWPELYFEGEGWVRFEPTPALVTGNAPPWTIEGTNAGGDSTDGAADPSASSAPSASESSASTPTPTPSDSSDALAPTDGAFPWGRVAAAVGVLLGVGALLAVPGLLRLRRRRLRLDHGGEVRDRVERAWAELRDTALDTGQTWPGGSPRSVGTTVAADLEAGPARALTALSQLVERARYARSLETHANVTGLTQEVLEGMTRHLTWDSRLLAAVWPKSLFAGVEWRVPDRFRFWEHIRLPGRHR